MEMGSIPIECYRHTRNREEHNKTRRTKCKKYLISHVVHLKPIKFDLRSGIELGNIQYRFVFWSLITPLRLFHT